MNELKVLEVFVEGFHAQTALHTYFLILVP